MNVVIGFRRPVLHELVSEVAAAVSNQTDNAARLRGPRRVHLVAAVDRDDQVRILVALPDVPIVDVLLAAKRLQRPGVAVELELCATLPLILLQYMGAEVLRRARDFQQHLGTDRLIGV